MQSICSYVKPNT